MFDGLSRIMIDGPVASAELCYGRSQRVWSQACSYFERAHRHSNRRRFWSHFLHRPDTLRSLNASLEGNAIVNRHDLGIVSVPLAQIDGSEGRTRDFDREFGPRQTHSRSRWICIAAALLSYENLPPIALIQLGDHYYVRDGHHRVSVARAIGLAEIDAKVTVWHIAHHDSSLAKGTQPPTVVA